MPRTVKDDHGASPLFVAQVQSAEPLGAPKGPVVKLREGGRRRLQKATIAMLLIGPLAAAAPATCSTDGCDAGCFMLGPGSSEYNRCMSGCQHKGSAGGTPKTGRPPTITDPQDIRPVTMEDVYALICNDLGVNGVSVPSVTKIHYRLMDDPDYQYTAREAGLTVSRAVENLCPKYRSALIEATRQALSR